MPTESTMLLPTVLSAILLLLLSGIVSASGYRSSVRVGCCGAVGACLIGLATALAALTCRAEESLLLPWSMPFGSFQLGIDPLSAFFLIPIFLLSGVAAVFAIGYSEPWEARKTGRFWFFYNALVASMALVVLARNGVLFLVAWEAMSLASFFLVIFDDTEPGVAEAGWVYLVATHIGTAFLIALFIMLGRTGGSQDFATFAIPAGSAGLLFLLALIGFGTKAGLFPLHVWLPEAHPAAPSPVSAVMSGVMIKTGIYGILRVLMILGIVPGWCAWLVLSVGIATGLFGILFALAQQDVKRMLAYSSVENIGIIGLGIGLGMLGIQYDVPAIAVLGFSGGLLHVFNHALFKGLLFLGSGAAVHSAGTRNIDRLGGLLRRMPWTGATFAVGAVAICGLPPFNGFIGEFLIYFGSFKAVLTHGGLVLGGALSLLALSLIGGLAVAGFTRAFGMIFLGEPRSPAASTVHEVGLTMRGAMIFLAGLCLAIGLSAGWIVRALGPVVAPFTSSVAAEGVRWPFPASVAGVFIALIVLVLVLAAVRRRLLARRSVRETVTWDCGYAAPSASMQYTATGYAQPLTHGARAILRPDEEVLGPRGIFPASGSFHTHSPDTARKVLFDPCFRRAGILLGRLRWLQQGRVHFYILYIVVVLVGLLAWVVAS